MAYPVWMDVDTGADDAVAIIAAHGLKELDIVGISAVSGNTVLENSFRNTRALNVIEEEEIRQAPARNYAKSPYCQNQANTGFFDLVALLLRLTCD